jgi:ferric-dicitrate binding protein FerR (iron transport regulator)
MNQPPELPSHWKDLIDDYLDGLLDEAGTQELEDCLRSDGRAREYFVRYARLHTHLHLEVRAQGAGARALERIEALAAPAWKGHRAGGWALTKRVLHWLRAPRRLWTAAGLLLAVTAAWWLTGAWLGAHRPEGELAIAWLVNAQDCSWSGPGPTGNLQAGKVLRIERGLAEIHFQCGARIILEGPSVLELLSSKSVRLSAGKLTARAPAEAIGFEVLSPEGRVIDLGTEFGVAADNGSTEVYVFQGKVEALPTAARAAEPRTVNLTEHQAARIASGEVTVRPVLPAAAESRFVRAIAPAPVMVPRTLRLLFDRPVDQGVKDRAGARTGLTYRLPGTGKGLPESDGNLHLNTAQSQLELTTTNSDLNTQYQLDQGEYLGVRLADLGFSGKEDFAVTVTTPSIPDLDLVGQFGLYAGAASDRNIRGGVIGRRRQGEYMQFLVNNQQGSDTPDICQVGLLSTGTDLRLTLRRTSGKYSLTVENLTLGSASTLTIRHPEFLDLEKDLYVGVFGANTQSEVRRTLVFKDLQVTVWTAVAPAPQ